MLVNTDDFRNRARKLLPRFVFDYIEGAADDGHCLRRNLNDLAAVELTPRVLRDTTTVDTAIEVFGRKWRLPFGVAPTGLNGLVRPGGDAQLAAAAAHCGIPFVLSTASNMRLEDVRHAVPHGCLWMQLYVMHRGVAEQIVRRAANAGYDALVLTVDVPVSGNRELDLRNGFRLPFNPTPRLAWDVLTHPRWSLRMAFGGRPEFANLVASDNAAGSAEMQAALLTRAMDRSLVWETLAWLRGLWKGPLLLKGVLDPQDARLALEHGVDGLIVSNHGGRQYDASPSAISALPRIATTIQGRIPLFMDGGIRRGGDVAKAVALGATAAFVGRAALYGLASGGSSGATSVMQILAADLIRAMTLLGATSAADLSAQR